MVSFHQDYSFIRIALFSHREPNFKARTVFFDFQNAGRQDAMRESMMDCPSRETIRSPSIVCRYIRAYIPTYTIERERIFTKPLLFINSLISVKYMFL